MTKKLFSILRYTSIVALVASLFIMSGCGDDEEPAPTMTISELIASDAFKQASGVDKSLALDSSVKYLNKYPELQALMTGTTPYTLFAPSNEAFINLLATPGFPSNIGSISPDVIKGVLAYHFVAEQKLQADLTAGLSLNSLYTEASYVTTASPTLPSVQVIKVNADLTLLTGSSNAAIKIITPDKKATNGVVHVVGTVMVPPSVGLVLIPILGKMAGTVLLGKDFTYLARMIGRADAGYVEDAATGKLKMVSHLARPTSTTAPVFAGATFFAPPNAVFEAAAAKAGVTATQFVDSFTTGATGTARAVLTNHYVFVKYVVTATAGSTTFTTGQISGSTVLSGKTITVNIGTPSATPPNPYGVTVSNAAAPGATNSWPIVVKDLPHSNGIIQVIGGILTGG